MRHPYDTATSGYYERTEWDYLEVHAMTVISWQQSMIICSIICSAIPYACRMECGKQYALLQGDIIRRLDVNGTNVVKCTYDG